MPAVGLAPTSISLPFLSRKVITIFNCTEVKSNCAEPESNCAETKSNRVETKSNRVETKSNRAGTVHFSAIRFFLLGIKQFLYAMKNIPCANVVREINAWNQNGACHRQLFTKQLQMGWGAFFLRLLL
jgi:L-lactate utilization protein LutC